MEAVAGPSPNRVPLNASVTLARLLRVVATVANTGTLLLAVMLLIRRLTGAVHAPLEPASLVVTALAMAAWACVLRLSWFQSQQEWQSAISRLNQWLPVVSNLCLGLTLTMPGAKVGPVLAFWGTLVIEEVVALTFVEHNRRSHRGTDQNNEKRTGRLSRLWKNRLPKSVIGPTRTRTTDDSANPLCDLPRSPAESEGVASNVIQKLTRVRESDGAESLHAVLTESAEPGQRLLVFHVSFCPPFTRSPEIEVEQREGPSGSIKVAQAKAYGARLDVRLPAHSTNETVTVELFARSVLQ